MSSKRKRSSRRGKPKPEPRVAPNIDPSAFYQEKPVWKFGLLDKDGPWGIEDMAKDFKEIFEKLKEYESMKWEEIMKASGGKRSGTNSHFVSIDGIIKEAKDYLNEIRSDDFDKLFSLRLNGKKRLYGILNDKVFKIVFYDRNHVIYPCHKK